MAAPEPLLVIEDLSLAAGEVRLTEETGLTVERGEMVGLIGESGCGKSLTALAIMGLLPSPPVKVAAGRILFQGTDLARLDARAMRAVRGRRIGMIFQEPMTSLNPVFTVGDQIGEALTIHFGTRGKAARGRAAELLALVGIPNPSAALDRYPHQLSGGQRQRVMIAMAIACEPALLIADEPTTALDVTVQKQVLDLIRRLRDELGLACLLITHDLGVVAEVCDRAYVMYAGRVVEEGPVARLLTTPAHRYTAALLETIPAGHAPGTELPAIPGQVPRPGARGQGCAFAPRCQGRLDPCAEARPEALAWDGGRFACWNPAAPGAPRHAIA